MSVQTIADMRALLALGNEQTDAEVVTAYAEYLDGPASDPAPAISLARAKEHLRVTSDAEDDLIAGYVDAATAAIEDFTGLVLQPRVITEVFDGFGRQGGAIDLKSWPVTAVQSVSYLDRAGNAQTLDPAAYTLNLTARPVRISMARGSWWPLTEWSADVVTITVQAGYATVDLIPKAIQQAILLLLGHWYSNRSAVEAGLRAAAIELPFAVDILVKRWRRRVL